MPPVRVTVPPGSPYMRVPLFSVIGSATVVVARSRKAPGATVVPAVVDPNACAASTIRVPSTVTVPVKSLASFSRTRPGVEACKPPTSVRLPGPVTLPATSSVQPAPQEPIVVSVARVIVPVSTGSELAQSAA